MVASPHHYHISPLHHQIVRGRDIVISEDPGLHLLWYYGRIFIKPLPPYLTNYAFWKHFLSGRDPSTCALRKAAMGYLRSYYYLIRHQSDFEIAIQTKLIPSTWTFESVLNFLARFQTVDNDMVPLRFQYGELRLSRLNLHVKLRGMGFFYHKVHGQYGTFFASTIGPPLFIFALSSIILAAMQVVLAVQQLGDVPSPWRAFGYASRWFSVICLFFSLCITAFYPLVLIIFRLRELVYAIKHGRH